jgi:DNA-binding response OmpR family regulator
MRILLVEDEKKLANMVARGLRAERFAVDLADSGEIGWAMVHTCEYDLFVLDLGLPGMDGLELLRRIRRRHAEVPILILTARDATASKVESFEAGADDYLTKPFVFAEFIVRIRALLRRGTVNHADLLRCADLEIELNNHTVKRAGRKIDLTPREYSLLEYLAKHSDRVVSRTMIVEHVWDQSFEGLTNIVDVYVRHLRDKIDDPFPVKLIRTVRGVGYQLTEKEER